MTLERKSIERLASSYLDRRREDAFGDFEPALADWTEELEAAITDRWVEWKERMNVGASGDNDSGEPDRAGVEVPVAKEK